MYQAGMQNRGWSGLAQAGPRRAWSASIGTGPYFLDYQLRGQRRQRRFHSFDAADRFRHGLPLGSGAVISFKQL